MTIDEWAKAYLDDNARRGWKRGIPLRTFIDLKLQPERPSLKRHAYRKNRDHILVYTKGLLEKMAQRKEIVVLKNQAGHHVMYPVSLRQAKVRQVEEALDGDD